jgi:hypothetical protein
MNNPLLMRMLNRRTNLYKKSKSLLRGQIIRVAIFRDLNSTDQFHYKVWPPIVRCSRIKHLRNVRMVHQRQRLPLRVEPRDHLLRAHPQLDQLQRHPPPNRRLLLRHVNNPAATLPDFLQNLEPLHTIHRVGDRHLQQTSRTRPVPRRRVKLRVAT